MMYKTSKYKILCFMMVAVFAVLLLPSGRVWAAYPLLSVGSRGEAVSRLQQELKNQGYYTYPKVTGYYGPITRDAVIRFQKARGLVLDGIAGNATQSALYSSSSGGVLKFGMRGQAVSRLQTALKQQGFFYANVTGYYGKITENSVIAFQKANGLRIDGIAGPQTQNAFIQRQGISNIHSCQQRIFIFSADVRGYLLACQDNSCRGRWRALYREGCRWKCNYEPGKLIEFPQFGVWGNI